MSRRIMVHRPLLAAQLLLLAWRSVAEITYTSLPIDVLVRYHLLKNDGSVLVRNVTSSSSGGRSSCYALYEKEKGADPATADDDATPVPDRGMVMGTGELFFGGDDATSTMTTSSTLTTTTTTNDDDVASSPREDTGEFDDPLEPQQQQQQQQLQQRSSYSELSGYDGIDVVVEPSHDQCRVRFEFRCAASSGGYRVDFGYVFASGEYRDADRGRRGGAPPAYGNDAIAVLLNGRNVALVRVGDGDGGDGGAGGGAAAAAVPVSVDSINSGTNSGYYVDHALDGRVVSAGGFTVELGPYYRDDDGGGATTTATTTTTSMLPSPGWNIIEFVIGDAGDDNVDSWAFLRANSFSCVVAAGAGGGATTTATATTTTSGGGGGGGGGGADATKATSSIAPPRGGDTATSATTRSRIPLLYAVVILIFLGLIALSLPVIGLTFYDKRITSA